MSHDPLCPQWVATCVDQIECALCELITKVRADERARWGTPWFSAEYHRGYRQGQADAGAPGRHAPGDAGSDLEALLWANNMALLEHTRIILSRTHSHGGCLGEHCTVHRRSNHHMRGFPQEWRGDRGIMERVCPHGVGHPDPDDVALAGPHAETEAVHGCDGCCRLDIGGEGS